ncbi:MAG: acylneuraminate cytidylyltransferase family protein [Victivallales bacterium]|jgi:CMP-N-acetylneuraminic acid synthetase|nr:acylneuraminate cytidylyltransferase family protein [Victivallales bacterium]MBT7298741.1 acylneuraminate cytidylyltransferase family protein [Victivallales bacterium]
MIFDRRVVALIPIKDHSERVTGKNFRSFAGKPLYHHIVHTLDRVYAVDRVLIDTDSPRVIDEAAGLSAKVDILRRPEELCGDSVSTNRIFAHDLAESDGDIYLQTHATNPLMRAETFARALKVFAENEETHDSLFGVTEHYSRFYDQGGQPINHNPEELIRTQDLPPLCEENSCVYVFTKESFGKHRRRIGETPLMFPTPAIQSIDIDDEFQFRLAELLALYAE